MLARVTALRLEAGIAQQEMSRIAGWHNSNWCALEKGRVSLPKERRQIVAEYFGVPEAMLFTEEGGVLAVSKEELVSA